MSDALEARILAAHAAGDGAALVTLYRDAADGAERPRVAAFFLTQAYVFALECGHPETGALRARLVAMGCEA
ncbi:MAG: hypothetical protein AAF771_13470 [Pseudomonadota bacterium]